MQNKCFTGIFHLLLSWGFMTSPPFKLSFCNCLTKLSPIFCNFVYFAMLTICKFEQIRVNISCTVLHTPIVNVYMWALFDYTICRKKLTTGVYREEPYPPHISTCTYKWVCTYVSNTSTCINTWATCNIQKSRLWF